MITQRKNKTNYFVNEGKAESIRYFLTDIENIWFLQIYIFNNKI